MSSEQRYNVIFRGKIDRDRNVGQVKEALATMFNVPMAQMEKMFSGQPVIVKANTDAQTASQYQHAFAKSGALCDVEPPLAKQKQVSDTHAKHYNVVFYGEVADGKAVEEVKKTLHSFFHLTPQQLQQAFSGCPFYVKERCDYQSALKYKQTFEQAGTISHIEPVHPSSVQSPKIQRQKDSNAPQPSPMTCPKCGHVQKRSPMCKRCGILVEKFARAQQHKKVEVEILSPLEIQQRRVAKQIFERYSARIKDNRIFFAPHIPEKQLKNALRKAGDDTVRPEDVAVVIDNSLTGSGKDGALVTESGIYVYGTASSEFERQHFEFIGIQSISFHELDSALNGELAKMVTSTLRLNHAPFLEVVQPKKRAMLLFSNMLEEVCAAVKNPVDYEPSSPSVTPIHEKKKISALEIIKKYSSKITDSNEIFFKAKGIPPKRVENAIRSYAPQIQFGDVFVLVDVTVFGNAKNGALLTKNTLFFKEINQKPQQFPYETMNSVNFVPGVLNDSIHINEIEVLTLPAVSRIATHYLFDMLKEISEAFKPSDVSSSAEKLKELKELFDSGVLTEKEFQEKRKKYLDRL